MQRTKVVSSQIEAIGYSTATKVLEVEFKPTRNKPDQPGSIYQYRNVPPQLHDELMKAESVGSYFIKQIKPFADRYPFTKIS